MSAIILNLSLVAIIMFGGLLLYGKNAYYSHRDRFPQKIEKRA